MADGAQVSGGLVAAAREARWDAVRALLAKGTPHVDETDEEGWTALYAAADQGLDDMVSTNVLLFAVPFLATQTAHRFSGLLRSKARPPYTKGRSPVWVCVAQVRVLVDAGANPNHSNAQGHIVLSSAAHNGHVNALRALLAAGADIHGSDNDGHTALYVAARQGHVAAVRALLEAGAPLDRRSKLGKSALDVAREVRSLPLSRPFLCRVTERERLCI